MTSTRFNAMFDLHGRVAFVTGASAGLGNRFARTLAEAGAAVVVAARRRERLAELVEGIRATGGRAHAVALDVADPSAIPHALDEAERVFGTIDILVNNAGMPDGKRAVNMPLEFMDRIVETNLRAPFILSTEVARRLIAIERPGRIVNISSMGAYQYSPASFASLYSVTKAGLIRMTEVLAVEWARHHINVNGIAPGLFQSEMSDGMIDRMGQEASDALVDRMPRKRIALPEQLDSTLLYLVSPASDAVTGTVIKVDDGQGGR